MPINIPAGAKVGDIVGKDYGPKTIFGQFSTTWVLIRPPDEPQTAAQAQAAGKLSSDQLHVTRSTYGAVIPRMWGTLRLGGMMIWATDLVEHTKTVTTTDAAGVSTDQLQYYYTASLAIAFFQGEATAVRRIYGDDQVIYDHSKTPKSQQHITVYLGTETQTADPTMVAAIGTGYVPAHRGLCYVVLKDFDLTDFDNKIPNFSAEITTGDETVGSILADLFGAVGLEAGDYDLAGACNGVDGFVIPDAMTARDAIAPLLDVFATDLAEVDGQLLAIHQGCGSAVTIDEADLGAVEWRGNEPSEKVQLLRQHDLDLPQRYDLTYLDATRNYEQSTQAALRYTKTAVQQPSPVTVPIVLSADQARQAAERKLYQQWLGRTQAQFSLPLKYLRIMPGTPVLLPVGGDLLRMKILGVDIGLFAELRFSAVLDADYALTQIAAGQASPITDVGLQTIYTSRWTVWSQPVWQDADLGTPGFYVAATGANEWAGADIYYSADGGTTYSLAGFVSDKAVWGTADTVLPTATDASAIDTTSTLQVTLETVGAVADSTQAAVDAGANAMLVGNELGGFVNTTVVSDQVYTLDHFRRGQRATPMSGHAAGERFVALSPAVVRIRVPTSLIGQTLLVKLIAAGEALADVTAKPVVIAAPSVPGSGPSYRFNDPANSQYVVTAF